MNHATYYYEKLQEVLPTIVIQLVINSEERSNGVLAWLLCPENQKPILKAWYETSSLICERLKIPFFYSNLFVYNSMIRMPSSLRLQELLKL